MKKKLRVLVVDDSAYNRRTIVDILDSHPDIEVIGMADDGEKALKAASALKPDLITLDLEMPRMDGFTFLRIVMSQMPTPVIVISSQNRKQSVFQVLELGALDFIAKPTRYFAAEEASLREEIISKALAVRSLQIVSLTRRVSAKSSEPVAGIKTSSAEVSQTKPKLSDTGKVTRIVCIGASTGGPPALQSIFKALSPQAGVAYLVAQHMPEKFTRAFAERLNRISSFEIQEAQEGMPIVSGGVYIAPGGAHLELSQSSQYQLIAKITPAQAIDRYSPSIDKLFDSAARVIGSNILAVVLTGMGADGSIGIKTVHEVGGKILAESQETAIVYGMPKEALQTGLVDESLPLDTIIERIDAFACG